MKEAMAQGMVLVQAVVLGMGVEVVEAMVVEAAPGVGKAMRL